MNLEQEAVKKLKKAGFFLSAVESCTGGLISQMITDVAGSSDVFWGGLVTYDNSAKTSLTDVPQDLIAQHGAVSREVAAAMAAGGLKRMKDAMQAHATRTGVRGWISVSTTGIAGPGGGSVEKPVGLCFVALATEQRTSVLELREPAGLTREEYRLRFAHAALDLLVKNLAQ